MGLFPCLAWNTFFILFSFPDFLLLRLSSGIWLFLFFNLAVTMRDEILYGRTPHAYMHISILANYIILNLRLPIRLIAISLISVIAIRWTHIIIECPWLSKMLGIYEILYYTIAGNYINIVTNTKTHAKKYSPTWFHNIL